MLKIARKLLAFLERRDQIVLAALMIPMLFASALEILSIGAVLPLAQIALGESKEEHFFTAYLPNWAQSDLIVFFAIGFAALFIGKNLFILFVTYLISRFTLTRQAAFQQRMFRLYINRGYEFHLQRNTAELIRDLSNGIGTAFEGIRLSMVLTMDMLLAIASCTLLLVLEPVVTLIITAALVTLAFSFYFIFAPLLQKWGRAAYGVEAGVIRVINHAFGAVKTIKVQNCEDYFFKEFREQTNHFAVLMTRSVTANQSPRFAIETLVVIGLLTAFAVLFNTQSNFDDVIAKASLFGMAALRLMPSMNRILSGLVEIRHRTALVESIYTDMLDANIEVTQRGAESKSVAPPFNHEITLSDVDFEYAANGNNIRVLQGFNLSLQKGKSVGIVGPSGGGKSTIIDLISCILRPTRGQLLIDGADVTPFIAGWREKIGYVPQHIYLTDDTLRRNIAFGIDDGKIDEARDTTAVQMAGLETFVATLKQGLDTTVGEGGARLSGGQRQRIGIARALYRDPEVLIFDEATSSLDNETEQAISEAIGHLSQSKTVIIVAHRLSTVKACSRLIFIREGAIAGEGTWDQLITENADFEKFATTENFHTLPGSHFN